MELVTAASVTRTELALADLDLNDKTTYGVMAAGPGAKSWRRQTAESPFMHGRALVGAVLDTEVAPLRIRVKGSTDSVLNTNLNALLRAFEQFTYDLTLTIEGVTYTWRCEPADYTIGDRGGEINTFVRLANQEWVSFEIPRNPIPVAGVI